KEIVKEVRKGNISEEMITEEIISNHLCTTNTPDPDLLIRTGGEQRISNYLLWQVAYAELYFTPTYWPDFDEQALMLAIDDYSNRERRYGLTGEQITTGIH
ncbi:MAG: polyprenyl diphosphate synthase, partial [Porphyromonadaceae bacterium]|nr:polyprenyl diphosphate synthase [Porphyromonadaceae bacterium]